MNHFKIALIMLSVILLSSCEKSTEAIVPIQDEISTKKASGSNPLYQVNGVSSNPLYQTSRSNPLYQ